MTRVSFLLRDGALGDSTAVDGVIVDPGGPAVPAGPHVPTLSPAGAGLLVVAMVIGARMGLRRRGKD